MGTFERTGKKRVRRGTDAIFRDTSLVTPVSYFLSDHSTIILLAKAVLFFSGLVFGWILIHSGHLCFCFVVAFVGTYDCRDPEPRLWLRSHALKLDSCVVLQWRDYEALPAGG